MRTTSFLSSLLLGAALLLGTSAHAQDIGDMFTMLPNEAAFNLSTQKRQQMLAGKRVNILAERSDAGKIYIDVLDKRNGYLKLNGAFEGLWEMCYWRMADQKTRLIGVAQAECGPACLWNMRFYQLDADGTLHDVSARMTQNFPKTAREFFAIERLTPAQRQEIESESGLFLLYELPRKGKDITVLLDDTLLDSLGESGNESVRHAVRRHKLTLRWTGNGFVRATSRLRVEGLH